jgi:hypothetical protein
MRIRVSDILELLGAGADFDEILEEYASLERETFPLPSITPLIKQTKRFCRRLEIPCHSHLPPALARFIELDLAAEAILISKNEDFVSRVLEYT